MKSELRGYVKGFKGQDQEKMQLHLNELLKLSELAVNERPVKIQMMNNGKSAMQGMDHGDMADMKGMDHSDMADMKGMDHGDMADMKGMDHGDMADMKGMDRGDMADMKGMEHGDMANMKNMDHGDMADMKDMDHGSMAGMTDQQHHQHMMFMQGMTKLQDLFKALENAQDKEQVKTILGQIKEHSKKSHQTFRQDCS